jgi:formate hydrogenlyase transcriptional activator
VEASLPHEAMATAHGVRDFVVLLKQRRRMRKQITSIPRRVVEILTNAPWKGNVRELENFIERAVILTHGDELEMPVTELGNSPEIAVPTELAPTFRQAEFSAIIEALRAASGRLAGNGGAAERLGLKRTTLQHKIRRLGITKEDYAPQAALHGAADAAWHALQL